MPECQFNSRLRFRYDAELEPRKPGYLKCDAEIEVNMPPYLFNSFSVPGAITSKLRQLEQQQTTETRVPPIRVVEGDPGRS